MSVPDYSADAAAFIGPRLEWIPGDENATREKSFDALNAFAAHLRTSDPRVGLLVKTGGARVRDRAADIIAYNLGNETCQLVDVIGDSEGHDGAPTVGWSLVTDHGIRPIFEWAAPYPVSGPTPEPEPQPEPEPEPKPQPQPQPPAVDLSAVLAELAAIRTTQRDLIDAVSRIQMPPAVDLTPILKRPFPNYEGRTFGVTLTLKPTQP